MKIRASDLTTGDVLQLNDWRLHVIAVERDVGTGVLTSEFDFLLHFTSDATVHVEPGQSGRRLATAGSAAA